MTTPRASLILALVSTLTLFAGCAAAHRRPSAVPAGTVPMNRIVDLHCHTAGIGAGNSGCFVSDRLRHSHKFSAYLHAFGTSLPEVETNGDAVIIRRISERVAASSYIGRAVVLALDGPVDAAGDLDRGRTELYIPNEFVAAEVARYPNLSWGASVNPYRPDALARLEWAKAHGAVLVKWLPSIQAIDPSDPRLEPYYHKLVELRLPLLTHTGAEHSFTSAHDAFGDPARLELPARLGVTIIAAHAATTGKYDGEPAFERLARLMAAHANVYADISSLTQLNKRDDLRTVLSRPECRGRLLYGSDYPLISIRALVSPWYHPDRVAVASMLAVATKGNPWDRDIELKQALGVGDDVWTRAESVLNLPMPDAPTRPALLALQRAATPYSYSGSATVQDLLAQLPAQ